MKGMVWQRDSTVGKMASHAGRVRRRYKRAVQGGRSLPEQNWKDQREKTVIGHRLHAEGCIR